MANAVFVIAEAGVNHNGSLPMALQLVEVAAGAGADAVKFQTFRSADLATAAAAKAEYQVANTGEAGSQRAMLRGLELSIDDHHTLVARCRELGIHFMSTAFDEQSLAFLATLDMPAIKISSGDLTYGPLLLQAARLRRPLIISTGMATLGDIERALGVVAHGLITQGGDPVPSRPLETVLNDDTCRSVLQRYVTLLHCVTDYPAAPEAVNLRAMGTLAAAFDMPVGYSDHTLGIEVSLAAVARGATMIEKHFTLDRGLPGPDHRASLEPEELRQLVAGIRKVTCALGSPLKVPAPKEMANRLVARRSIVAARAIGKGERLEQDMLTFKRPGCGISPMEYWDLLGRPAARDYMIDETLER